MKHVFIFSNQPLFDLGIESLLRQESELGILGWETDLEKAIRRIKEIHPDVVILAGEDVAADSGPAVTRILKECPGLRVVEVNLETNVLHIYGGEQRWVREVRDLMDVIRHSPAAGAAEFQVPDRAALGARSKTIEEDMESNKRPSAT